MFGKDEILSTVLALGVLTACTPENPFQLQTLPKGAQVDVRKTLAANPGKLGCVDYEAATNSCASLISANVSGNKIFSREAGVVLLPDGVNTQRIEVRTRSTVQGSKACAAADDISVAGKDEISIFVLDITRGLIEQVGGSVCGIYYQSGDSYVVSSFGADGSPFPPGDSALRFVDPGGVRLRAR